ncbi:hypothetical protein cypCar_00047261, partial [Cyprinus carpio]
LLHHTTFNDTIETPENKTVTLLIRPDRADDGAEYWCAAELDLGADGPQPHPTYSAKPLSIAVHDRADDEAEYWCEAELDLGAEGPQPHPTISAKPLNVEVYYKPKHSNSTETIIQDDKDMLDCTVKVNPAPTYTWDHLKEKISSSVLKSSELSPGRYTCTATNTLGRDSKVFIVKSTGECGGNEPLQIDDNWMHLKCLGNSSQGWHYHITL